MIRIRFRSKLVLLATIPIVIAQLVTLLAVMHTVEGDVRARADASLDAGATIISEYLKSRSEQLQTSVDVLSADFGLKQAAATGDSDTIRSALENHGGRIGAHMALVLDDDGGVLASTLDGAGQNPEEAKRLIEGVDDGGVATTAVIAGNAYQVFVEPLRAPVRVGWVLLGFRIDAGLVERLSGLTGLDVAVVAGSADSRTVLASTVGEEGLLQANLSRARSDDTLLTRQFSFNDANGNVSVILQRSLQEAMTPYVDARRGLAVFGMGLIVVVAIAGTLFSTTISRPLSTLADASKRLAAGHYEEDVRVSAGDEFADLADTFNAMRSAISDRERRITHQALHDRVTDLPNRYRTAQHLTACIDRAAENKSDVAVLSIKLTGMARIASTLGHKASDALVRLAAKQLRENLSADDFLGHFGANEFCLIVVGQSAESAHRYVESIEAILASGIHLDEVDVELRAAVGISAFPLHGKEADELLRFASVARTDAEEGKEPVRVYETGREDVFLRRLRVVNDLKNAIDQGEVSVWFQPKLQLPEGTVHGTEALVRWHHPELGFLPPDEFIPAAEQAGTLMHLTRYVLAKAIKQVRVLADAGYKLQASVNLSVKDLMDEYLPYHVMQLLADYGVAPENLTLEVTESSIMEDVARSVLVLDCLRDIGVRISMDDFGTGHSSLGQLRNLPLHELKIDRCFVQSLSEDARNEPIVRTTIELARDLGLEVVAEGVEDENTIRRLAELGCHQAQGYFIGKPMPFPDLMTWLEQFEATGYGERRGPARAFSA
ncbi:MAG: EAL domain-containing protein [Pseudomonadota bacterium]